MPDVFSKEKRSEVMSKIRGRGNKDTELALIKLLKTAKISGWRRNLRIFGKPDFVFKKEKVAVFVDGCFWHACPKHSNIPVNNREKWRQKLSANKARDRLVNRKLKDLGWVVVRIWEHELKSPKRVVNKIQAPLKNSRSTA